MDGRVEPTAKNRIETMGPAQLAREKTLARFQVLSGREPNAQLKDRMGGETWEKDLRSGWELQTHKDQKGFEKEAQHLLAMGGVEGLNTLQKLLSSDEAVRTNERTMEQNKQKLVESNAKLEGAKQVYPRELLIAKIVSNWELTKGEGSEEAEVLSRFGFDDIEKAKAAIREAWNKQYRKDEGAIKSAEELMILGGAAKIERTKEVVDAYRFELMNNKKLGKSVAEAQGVDLSGLTEDEKWVLNEARKREKMAREAKEKAKRKAETPPREPKEKKKKEATLPAEVEPNAPTVAPEKQTPPEVQPEVFKQPGVETPQPKGESDLELAKKAKELQDRLDKVQAEKEVAQRELTRIQQEKAAREERERQAARNEQEDRIKADKERQEARMKMANDVAKKRMDAEQAEKDRKEAELKRAQAEAARKKQEADEAAARKKEEDRKKRENSGLGKFFKRVGDGLRNFFGGGRGGNGGGRMGDGGDSITEDPRLTQSQGERFDSDMQKYRQTVDASYDRVRPEGSEEDLARQREQLGDQEERSRIDDRKYPNS